MSQAIRIFQGRFGRVALLDMDAPLVGHAHHHCHILIKASGVDSAFRVRGNLAPLTDDTAVLVNAWEYHAYEPTSPERTLILALYIEPTWLADIQQSLRLCAHPRFFPQTNTPLSQTARQMVNNFVLELWWTDEFSPALLEQLLVNLVGEIIHTNTVQSAFKTLLSIRPAAGLDARIRRAITRLRETSGCGISIDELSADVGLSRAQFFALFRRDTQVTPLVYANVLRFESAVSQLTQTQKSIAEIADDLHFAVPSHFSRFFREHMGITPSDYRCKVHLMPTPSALQTSPTAHTASSALLPPSPNLKPS